MSKYTSTMNQSPHPAIARKQVKTTGKVRTAKIPLKTSTVKQTSIKSAVDSDAKRTTAVATIPNQQTTVKTKTVKFSTTRPTTMIEKITEKPTTKTM